MSSPLSSASARWERRVAYFDRSATARKNGGKTVGKGWENGGRIGETWWENMAILWMEHLDFSTSHGC